VDVAERRLKAEFDRVVEVVAKIELVLAHAAGKGFTELAHGI
jgi:hypothetical protein